jgi:hypothetical protein
MDEQNLFNKIMLRIGVEKRAMAIKRKIAVFSVMLAVSFVGLIPAVKAAHSGFVNSGFTQLFSLIFSDTAIVISSWQNFALAILETLPINGILIIGVLAIIFFSSLKFLSNNIKNNYEYRQNFSIKNV